MAALHVLGPYLESFSRSATADDEFAQAIMRRHGVPDDLATVLGSVGAAFRAFGSSGRVTIPLHDGEELRLRDRSSGVFHRPGHSPSDTIFWDEEREILIAGDHLLAHISSNPLVSRPLTDGPADPSAPRPRALLQLHRVDAGHPRAARPSSSSPVTATRCSTTSQLIDERLRMHRPPGAQGPSDPRRRRYSAYEIALRMWGNVAVTQAYLTLSEVLGHLDLLVEAGQAVERDEDGLSRSRRPSCNSEDTPVQCGYCSGQVLPISRRHGRRKRQRWRARRARRKI